MQFLILVLIVVTGTFDYLEKINWLPHGVSYLQELIGAGVLLYVVAFGVRDRFRLIRPAYWLVFAAITLVMLCGVIVNGVDAGPIFAGLRNYLRAIPLFLLPAVFAFTEPQIRKQLLLLLLLCLIQIPIATDQRLATAWEGGFTGDATSGTLMISSILSIFLICAACVLTGLYLRKRIRFQHYVLLLFLILVPTTINETKGTLVLLPLGLLVTFILGSPPRTRARNTVAALGLLAIFISSFVVVYDYVQKGKPYTTGIVAFFIEGKAEQYVSRGAGFGAESRDVGRMDAIIVSVNYLARDPVDLAFGLGIGNASNSSLGEQFKGEHYYLLSVFMQSTAVRLFLETGILGLLLVIVLMYLIYKDARAVADADPGLIGALAVGWVGVTVVIAIALFYKDLLPFGAVSFLFWYFSGLISARRMRLAQESRA